MRTARPETIRGFYEKHYSSDALAVIVVGAVPDAVQVNQLDRAFAPYFRKGAARPWPRAPEAFFPDPSSFGAAVFAEEAPRWRVRASVFEDAEATSAFAAVSVAKRYEAATTCVEINQCAGYTRQFFTKSFLGDDAAVLARSSGEEPASPRHRAGVASMAWRTTR